MYDTTGPSRVSPAGWLIRIALLALGIATMVVVMWGVRDLAYGVPASQGRLQAIVDEWAPATPTAAAPGDGLPVVSFLAHARDSAAEAARAAGPLGRGTLHAVRVGFAALVRWSRSEVAWLDAHEPISCYAVGWDLWQAGALRLAAAAQNASRGARVLDAGRIRRSVAGFREGTAAMAAGVASASTSCE